MYTKVAIMPMSILLTLINCPKFAKLVSTIPPLNSSSILKHILDTIESLRRNFLKNTISMPLAHKQINNNSIISSNVQFMFKFLQLPQKCIFIIALTQTKQGVGLLHLVDIFLKFFFFKSINHELTYFIE